VRSTSPVVVGLGLLLAAPVVGSVLVPERADARAPALLASPAHGTGALARLGDDVAVAAGRSGLTLSRLTEILETDDQAWVDREGQLFYADAAETPTSAVPDTSAAASPYDQTFLLHSRPSSTRVIYLDFDGYELHDTAWNASGTPALTVPRYTKDADPAFSAGELDVVQEVWARVSEDYAPFDVDVTTEDPGTADLARTSAGDTAYGARVAVTTDTSLRSTILGCGGGCAGVSYVGTYDTVLTGYPEYYQPAFVLGTTGYSAASLADIASHEAGHNLGLSHDGQGLSPYYRDPDGTRLWSPVMGAGYTPLTQFSNGDYPGATQTQDDFSVISQNGPPLVGDEYGDTTATAYPLTGATPVAGVIGSRSDVDVFRVTQACAGTLAATLAPAALGADLDTRLRLLDANGVPLAIDAPPAARAGTWSPVVTGLGSAVSREVPPGTYYLEVDGVGLDDPVQGYGDYGSVGRYALTVSGCLDVAPPPGPPATPTPTPSAAPTTQPAVSVPAAPVLGRVRPGRPGGATTIRLAWRTPVSTGGAPLTSYDVSVWRVDARGRQHRQGAYVVRAADRSLNLELAPGRYSFAVSATNYVGDGPRSTRSAPVRAR
jgi:hypothetical protein